MFQSFKMLSSVVFTLVFVLVTDSIKFVEVNAEPVSHRTGKHNQDQRLKRHVANNALKSHQPQQPIGQREVTIMNSHEKSQSRHRGMPDEMSHLHEKPLVRQKRIRREDGIRLPTTSLSRLDSHIVQVPEARKLKVAEVMMPSLQVPYKDAADVVDTRLKQQKGADDKVKVKSKSSQLRTESYVKGSNGNGVKQKSKLQRVNHTKFHSNNHRNQQAFGDKVIMFGSNRSTIGREQKTASKAQRKTTAFTHESDRTSKSLISLSKLMEHQTNARRLHKQHGEGVDGLMRTKQLSHKLSTHDVDEGRIVPSASRRMKDIKMTSPRHMTPAAERILEDFTPIKPIGLYDKSSDLSTKSSSSDHYHSLLSDQTSRHHDDARKFPSHHEKIRNKIDDISRHLAPNSSPKIVLHRRSRNAPPVPKFSDKTEQEEIGSRGHTHRGKATNEKQLTRRQKQQQLSSSEFNTEDFPRKKESKISGRVRNPSADARHRPVSGQPILVKMRQQHHPRDSVRLPLNITRNQKSLHRSPFTANNLNITNKTKRSIRISSSQSHNKKKKNPGHRAKRL